MKKSAFTLIEILISLVIFSGLFVALAAILVTGNRIYSGVMNAMDLRQNARNAMERIVRELRESNAVTVTPDPVDPDSSSITFWGPRYKDASGALCPIRYSLANGKIWREFPPGTIKPVAIDVTRLDFTLADPQVDVLVRTAKTADQQLLEFSLKQKVRMRNRTESGAL